MDWHPIRPATASSPNPIFPTVIVIVSRTFSFSLSLNQQHEGWERMMEVQRVQAPMDSERQR